MNIRPKLVKTALILAILVITLTITEATVKFAKDYKYLGFEKRSVSWSNIAEAKEGELWSCQNDLKQAIDDKHTAIEANNQDLFK